MGYARVLAALRPHRTPGQPSPPFRGSSRSPLPVLGDDGLSLRVWVGYMLLLLVAFLGNLSSRIYLSGSPVPSFLPREPKPLAVVTFRGEGSNGLAHDYLYSRTSAVPQCKPKEL